MHVTEACDRSDMILRKFLVCSCRVSAPDFRAARAATCDKNKVSAFLSVEDDGHARKSSLYGETANFRASG